ncbi:uncharacterized protein LOC108734337 [Agrilus planipennis]|uniref:Uncharacterized protein LOC108734337 n=1 Tax=Agrilus planipennis TaxID=224129 RepID=A0A7F5R1W7_AGRPL|nr:uncharacterized protein LOC108734337 [Agrilus planipennis]
MGRSRFKGIAFRLYIKINNETFVQGGCSTFGHSCYGGMGKRANDEEVNAEVFQEIEQDNPEIIFTGPRNSEVDETWAPEPKLSLQQYRHFSPYLKQWLRKYLAEKESLRSEN